jgi:sterol 3beta-glucosyltransferase
MAHITILAVGSRGDVQPFLALGLGLQAAGHDVRLATHAAFESFVRDHGLEFAPLVGDPLSAVRSPLAQTAMRAGRNPFTFLMLFLREGLPHLPQLNSDIWAACRGTGAVIFSTLAIGGYHIAKQLGVPRFAVHLQPHSRTRQYPTMFLPQTLPFGGAFNLLTHHVAEQVFWQAIRAPHNRWLQDTLGVPPEAFFGPYAAMLDEHMPVLYPFSAQVQPRPADWPAWHHITGYWFLEEEAGWRPPQDLLDFLAGGPPPIYVGFGSMASGRAEQAAEVVIDALRQTGQRGVLLSGWGGLSPSDLPDSVHLIESAPHAWLFPRMAAVVHHGGSGTTAAGLRAGVPSILVPHFADQPYWAERVHALGVGPRGIPRARLTARRLARAIRRALEDEDLRARAAALGEQLRAEDGVARAAEIIADHILQFND